MKNIFEILANLGVEVPENLHDDLEKAVNENYKTVSEVNKKIGKLEAERDGFKTRAETAENTLKGFDGVDVDTIKKDLETYKQKAADAEKDFNQKIYERDFKDALTAKLNDVKFSSEYARKAVEAEIISKKLQLDNGKILGIDDVISSIKERDPSAFVTDNDEHKARFTKSDKSGGGKQYSSRDEIMAIKDSAERQTAIANNLELFE